MATRRALKGVGAGLLGSFVSRNNDVEGYWGMGVLLRYASERGLHELTIDLLDAAASPVAQNEAPQIVAQHYGAMLKAHLQNAAIDSTKISRVRIEVRFGTSGDLPMPPLATWGRPFVCTAVIVDDRGRAWSNSKAGVCGPHDPRRESRRDRAQWGGTSVPVLTVALERT